jgi:hypothetical protein
LTQSVNLELNVLVLRQWFDWWSGWLGRGLINQKDRNVVAYRIDAAAFSTFQALAILFQHERLLANRANEDVEKVLGDHSGILRSKIEFISEIPTHRERPLPVSL